MQVIRSNRKTMSLSISRAGEVVVRAPFRVPESEIGKFVLRHEGWLKKHLAENRTAPDFSDGCEIPIAGKVYTICEGQRARIAKTEVSLPKEGREEALKNLLRRIARMRMKGFLDRICSEQPLSYSKLAITSARGRWGSCSGKSHISFSFRTAFLPDGLCEYLAVHELCHTLHMNHSAAFWREVEKILPDYKERRRALKSYLWAMNCL